jgi:colanic acid biosynthesis glycosyl transferase WcaI
MESFEKIETKSNTIWVVSELYYPEETSTGHFMTWIAEALAKVYTVKVISAKPTYAARGVRVPRIEIRNNVEIRRCYSTAFNKDRLFFRLINVVTICLSVFLTTCIRVKKGEVVLVVTNPPLLPYAVILACLLRRAKCVVRVDDVYPDILVASGIISKNGFPFRLLNNLVLFFIARTERVIVLGRDMHELMADKVASIRDRLSIITNWADAAEVTPTPRTQNILIRELGLQDKFIVQCAGNIGRVQGIEVIFDAARKLCTYEDVHFMFIGSGAKKRWLLKQIKMNSLRNITILDNRPRSDQANFLNACDIAVVSLVRGMLGISVPSRTYNILAAGKPLIAIVDENSEIALTVKEERVGWIVSPENSDEITRAILEARSNSQRRLTMGKRARSIAENKYARERVLNSYFSLISVLMNK